MKKIGIITILKVNNYGAELQAFALQRKLCLMGYEAEIIDYLFYKHKDYRREKASRPFYPFPWKKRIKENLLPIVEALKSLPNRKTYRARCKGFDSFHQRNTRFSLQTYHSYSELYNNVPDYDVYCVGSDQVWNPNCYTSLNPYLLTFVPKGKKRVSYASSFGVSAVPSTAIESYRSGIRALDCISVREKTGQDLVRQLTGREATVVADPTLLLTRQDWMNVARMDKVPKEDFLLLYVLRDSDYITQMAKIEAQKRGLKLVRLCKIAHAQDGASSGIINIVDAAPDDFIGLFSKAKMVMTNSFHGTVFSNIFHCDYYAILPKGKDNNSRIVDLLDRLGCPERHVMEDCEFKEANPLDWDAVDAKLEKFVELSECYIHECFD